MAETHLLRHVPSDRQFKLVGILDPGTWHFKLNDWSKTPRTRTVYRTTEMLIEDQDGRMRWVPWQTAVEVVETAPTRRVKSAALRNPGFPGHDPDLGEAGA